MFQKLKFVMKSLVISSMVNLDDVKTQYPAFQLPWLNGVLTCEQTFDSLRRLYVSADPRVGHIIKWESFKEILDDLANCEILTVKYNQIEIIEP